MLKMEGGDTSACPGGKQRQTVVGIVWPYILGGSKVLWENKPCTTAMDTFH